MVKFPNEDPIIFCRFDQLSADYADGPQMPHSLGEGFAALITYTDPALVTNLLPFTSFIEDEGKSLVAIVRVYQFLWLR